MTVRKSVNLMLKSSNNHPHIGILSKKANVSCAIDLAQLFKKFAEKGQLDNAMDLDVNHWQQVFSKVQIMYNDL